MEDALSGELELIILFSHLQRTVECAVTNFNFGISGRALMFNLL